MRPPAIQAERLFAPVLGLLEPPASMRPPAIQAERLRIERPTGIVRAASMRPPAIQAERREHRQELVRVHRCFNEAACNTGGTPPASPQHWWPRMVLQ